MPQHTIGVSVRVRPSPSGEHDGHGGLLSRHSDWVSRVVEGSDQTESFSALGSELVTRLRSGYSCTLLAYGQTGSGKTYTMFGPTGCLTESALAVVPDGGVPEAWGIFPRVVSRLLVIRGPVRSTSMEYLVWNTLEQLSLPLSLPSVLCGPTNGPIIFLSRQQLATSVHVCAEMRDSVCGD